MGQELKNGADPASEGMAPDTGPLPEAVVPVLAKALERATAQVFRRANRIGQETRRDPWALSMSGLGGCPRQAAYRLAEVAPTDPALSNQAEARQAMLGTWIHAGLLPHLPEVLHHADIEIPLELRVWVKDAHGAEFELVIYGTADCYSHVMGGGVLDLKTVNAYRLGAVDHDGVYNAHRKQVRGYATAARQLGLPVAWVAWLYLDRSTGEALVAVEPFGEEEEAETLEHVERLWETRKAPDAARRGFRGPGLSVECDGCAWLRQCWGPGAKPGDSSALQVHDDPAVALAARKYKELAAQIKNLKDEQEVYGAMVGRPKPGSYRDADGEMIVKYQKDGEEVDKKAAVEALVLLGGEVPMKKRQGNRMIEWGRKEPEG